MYTVDCFCNKFKFSTFKVVSWSRLSVSEYIQNEGKQWNYSVGAVRMFCVRSPQESRNLNRFYMCTVYCVVCEWQAYIYIYTRPNKFNSHIWCRTVQFAGLCAYILFDYIQQKWRLCCGTDMPAVALSLAPGLLSLSQGYKAHKIYREWAKRCIMWDIHVNSVV